MKHLLLALLLAAFSSVMADTPAKISEDYQKQSGAALVKLNETLEKATTPLIAALIKSGDTAGAGQLTEQLKAKTAGNPVPMPHASAVLLFAQYDLARARALEPVKKAAVSRIEDMLSSKEGMDLATVTSLARVREEVASGGGGGGGSPAVEAPIRSAGAPKVPATRVQELVEKLGGKYFDSAEGVKVDFVNLPLTLQELQQICTDRRITSFSWNSGKGSLTDEGLAAFAGLNKLDNLFLWATGHITDAGVEHLAACENLRAVALGGNGGGISGSSFAALARCKKLEIISLNGLSNVQGRHLTALIPMKALNNLSLSACKEITDADLDVVAQMPGLNYLNLCKTGVTNAGLVKLLPLKHLATLEVSSQTITPEGVKPLEAARPALRVIFRAPF